MKYDTSNWIWPIDMEQYDNAPMLSGPESRFLSGPLYSHPDPLSAEDIGRLVRPLDAGF